MASRIIIVPADATVLVDGVHLTHPDMAALDLEAKLAAIRPVPQVHVAACEPDMPMARIEWSVPATWITKEQFRELFGDAIADHEMFFIQNEAEAENWQRDDEALTQSIAEQENALFSGTK